MRLTQKKVEVNPIVIDFEGDEVIVIEHFIKNSCGFLDKFYKEQKMIIYPEDFSSFFDFILNEIHSLPRNSPIKKVFMSIFEQSNKIQK